MLMRIAALVGALLAIAPARAQTYPTQPVRALNVMGAGGSSDVFIRALGDELAKRWGQPVLVENRPGGGTTIGARACAQAPKDGTTFCIFPGETVVYNPFLFKSLGYDPEKDFAPISMVFFNTQVLVVNAKLGVKTMDELAALSKAKPGTLSFFSASISLQVFMERWKRSSGADMVWVISKSGGEAINGVLAGSTPVAFYGVSNFIQLIDNGSVTALAIDGSQRSPLLPNVPTLSELGYKERLPRVFFGLFAPAGTPREIVDQLYRDIASVGSQPEFRKKRLVDLALEPVFSTPDEFARFLAEERPISEQIVKEAGLKMN